MYEDVKTYLRGYRNAKKDYIRAKLELEECETNLTSITIDYSKEKVNTSPNGDKLAEAIQRLDALKEKCINTRAKAIEQMEKIHETIEQVEDAVLKDLLTRYYILGHTWEKVCCDTDCSWMGVHKRHARALEQVKKLL